MDNQVTTSNNNEIITEEGAMPSSSTTSGSNINYEGTTIINDNNIKEGMNSTSNNNEMNEDHVTVFVAYDGKWEWDGKERLFKDSRGSIMLVSKYVTLSEIKDIICKKLYDDQDPYDLKLEVHYRVGFPIIEINCDEDLSLFISESSKTKLLLCVTALFKGDVSGGVEEDEIIPNIKEESPIGYKEHVTVFVAYNGIWESDGKEWLFKESKGSIMSLSKYVTLSQITHILCAKFDVDQDSYGLTLEVYYGVGFPIIEIKCDEDLLLFISKSLKTELLLCVTAVLKDEINPYGSKDDSVEIRLFKAIQKNDWVKAREIISNTKEVTWTSELDEGGQTAFHFAVGRYKDNEVVRDLMVKNSELLVTTVNINGENPAHSAAYIGNTEALKIMLEYNTKCLFTHDYYSFLPIHYALTVPALKTFHYLFKEMKSHQVEFDIFLRSRSALLLLSRVIDTGLIDVAYELINDYPSMTKQVFEKDDTKLEDIVKKPELFYSGTHYNLWQKFVYHYVPIENNSGGSSNTADVENQETPKKDKFVTKYMRRCLHDVISRICFKLWETTVLHVPHVKQLKDDKVKHNTNIKLLRRICEEVDITHTLSDIKRLYSYPFCSAVENNTAEAIDVLTTYFPGLYYSVKGGHNIYQLTVLNRSEKVYSYILHHEPYAKTTFMMSMDDDDNNILHLAGHLAPLHRLNVASGAALQMQRELQWFEEVKRVVGIAHTLALNKNKQTPMMVFRKEHENLRKDGEEWMKKTADSYTITTALIITIVFAAAITVPGGNDDKTGKPIYETKPSFIIFAVADAISLFTATTSLLLFLSILTARYADEDFLYKLPKRLIIGLVMLFLSVTSMMIAFSAALYIMFGQGKAWILIPTAALACLPIVSFVRLQFPLLVELIYSTYGHGMFGKEKVYGQSSANANKKKRT